MSSSIKRAAFAAASACLICLATTASAATTATDPDATALDTIVTVASRMPLPASETLAPIVVIDRATIERSLAADLSDLLRFTAGIQVGRSGGPGQTASVFLRGSESNHALLLLDGIEMNPGTIGGPPLSAIPLAAIDHIEIVFGPRSTMYGSEAIGGVIDIVTKRGLARDPVALAATVGTHGTTDLALSAGQARGAWDAAIDVERFATDGYPIQPAVPVDRGNDRSTLNATLGWRGGLWDARLRQFVSEGTQEYVDFVATPVSQSFQDRTTSLALTRDDGEWRSTLLLARYHDDGAQDQPNPFTTATDYARSDRDSLDWQNDFGVGRHALTLGTAWSDESTAAESFGLYRESTRVLAVYAQDRVAFGADDLALAWRWTDHSTAGDQVSWNLEYGHGFGADWRLTANAGSGFRAPDSSDRYTPCCGNPLLKPEFAEHAELALGWIASAASTLRLGAFQTRIHDLISFGPSFVLENIDEATVQGIEAAWRTTHAAWSWEARALVQHTEDLATGLPLPRRADRTLTSRYARTLGRFELGADLLLSSGSKDSSFSTVHNPGYGLLDLSTSFAVSETLSLRARLENACDKAYVTADGYANPGRSLFVGLDARW